MALFSRFNFSLFTFIIVYRSVVGTPERKRTTVCRSRYRREDDTSLFIDVKSIVKMWTGLNTKSAVFWAVTPYSLLDVYRHFRGTNCFQLHRRGVLVPWWLKHLVDPTGLHSRDVLYSYQHESLKSRMDWINWGSEEGRDVLWWWTFGFFKNTFLSNIIIINFWKQFMYRGTRLGYGLFD